MTRGQQAQSRERSREPDFGAAIGGDILGLVIDGMYNDPLVVYREYIQNAADAITASGKPENRNIEIRMDIGAMRAQIRDNGPGLTYRQSERELIPISNSRKKRRFNRGFRGIGRLAGLAFSDETVFLTRSKAEEPVTKIIWNGAAMRQGIEKRLPLEEILSECIVTDTLPEGDHPAEFFEVQLNGVSRHAAASILNRDAVYKYIGETCPVPFGEDFQYKSEIANLFAGGTPPLELEIYLDDEDKPVTRPHQNAVHLSQSRQDEFSEFEEIKIPASDGKNYAATGWIAHSSYQGALPKDLGMRGMRARVGNIQIGNETAFDHLFTETRFNRWCVAEVHIVDPRIVPNGRRDYFEPGPHLRNLENHLSAICRKVEKRCRAESGKRNQQRQFESFLNNADATFNLAKSGYLDTRNAQSLINQKLSELDQLQKKNGYAGRNTEGAKELDALKRKLANFKVRPKKGLFQGIPLSEAAVYKKVFATLVNTSSSPAVARDAMDAILKSAKKK